MDERQEPPLPVRGLVFAIIISPIIYLLIVYLRPFGITLPLETRPKRHILPELRFTVANTRFNFAQSGLFWHRMNSRTIIYVAVPPIIILIIFLLILFILFLVKSVIRMGKLWYSDRQLIGVRQRSGAQTSGKRRSGVESHRKFRYGSNSGLTQGTQSSGVISRAKSWFQSIRQKFKRNDLNGRPAKGSRKRSAIRLKGRSVKRHSKSKKKGGDCSGCPTCGCKTTKHFYSGWFGG